MKKLVLFFAAAVAVSFASCGSKTPQGNEEDGIDAIVVDVDQIDDTTAVVSVDELEAVPAE